MYVLWTWFLYVYWSQFGFIPLPSFGYDRRRALPFLDARRSSAWRRYLNYFPHKTCWFGRQPLSACRDSHGTCTGNLGRCKRRVRSRLFAWQTLWRTFAACRPSFCMRRSIFLWFIHTPRLWGLERLVSAQYPFMFMVEQLGGTLNIFLYQSEIRKLIYTTNHRQLL